MEGFFVRSNQWLSKYMFLTVLIAIALGFFIPLENSAFLSALATGLFAYMTFVSALKTTFRDFARILMKPSTSLWIIFLIHGVTPLLAWSAGLLFYPDDFTMRVGLLIGSAIPIAVTSVIWTTIAKGDVALALVTVTLDTLLIPVLIPFFFKMVIGTSISLDYGDLVIRLLLMVTIPSILGMMINELTKGRLERFADSVGGSTSKIATSIVILINSAIVLPQIHWDMSVLKLMIIILTLVSLNYFIGFLGSYLLKDRSKEVVVAMTFNVGMRNTSFGSVLAISFFPPAVAIPVIITLLYQQPIAAILSSLFTKRYRKSQLG
jgi:predicted Na+-dependent transporter